MEQGASIVSSEQESPTNSGIRSLKELIDFVNGRSVTETTGDGDAGFAEHLAFPFLALVGQNEMKMALVLALINPAISGVLLIGPRGTGKTTAIRGLLDLLPPVLRSTCFYGCLPEDVEDGGIDSICPDCAKKYGENEPISTIGQARLVELPLNTALDDVIGGLDDNPASHIKQRVKRGLLAQADRNILFVDEVNLLPAEITNAILDAAAQGTYTIRRGPASATYRARFSLIGSMNPEEGNIRSQILDRFGLRVVVRGLKSASERIEAYRRVRAFLKNPRQMIAQYNAETVFITEEIIQAREILKNVEIPAEIAKQGIALVQSLQIDSLRAEITLFEAARACAAADGRIQVSPEDLRTVSAMSLRLRHSHFMEQYLTHMDSDEDQLNSYLNKIVPEC